MTCNIKTTANLVQLMYSLLAKQKLYSPLTYTLYPPLYLFCTPSIVNSLPNLDAVYSWPVFWLWVNSPTSLAFLRMSFFPSSFCHMKPETSPRTLKRPCSGKLIILLYLTNQVVRWAGQQSSGSPLLLCFTLRFFSNLCHFPLLSSRELVISLQIHGYLATSLLQGCTSSPFLLKSVGIPTSDHLTSSSIMTSGFSLWDLYSTPFQLQHLRKERRKLSLQFE